MGRDTFYHGRSYIKITAFFLLAFVMYWSIRAYMNLSLTEKTKPIRYIAKPHVVFGILSSDKARELRDYQRKTWISSAMQTNLPFRLTYKFLLDLPTTENKQENELFGDIIYLNATHHGRAVKFGEKIYNWMKIITEEYPDALLSARIDDDVYLCVPQIFHRLDTLKSTKLYYGWGHGNGGKITRDRRIDEMFVVLGRDLIHRIAERKYCADSNSCGENDLIDTNYGGTSLGAWLSSYTDVEFYTDNKQIMHVSADYSEKHPDVINPTFCDKWLLYHKATPGIMKQLDGYNRQSKICSSEPARPLRTPGAVTGSLFSGDIVRDLPSTGYHLNDFQATETDEIDDCDNWAVVTTIFNPSEAVIQMSKEPDWCLVIVADEKTPKQDDYLRHISGKRVLYLSTEVQNKLYPSLSSQIPLNHFGRKNIGYMYAIHHKAQAIWDFDDDNIGIIKLNDFTKDKKLSTVCPEIKSTVVNPYPYFGPLGTRIWPRGFPLQHIKDNKTIPKICELKSVPQLGIIQSLANVQPDVDAIYRLTHDMPLNFTAKTETHPHLVLPKNVYAPFNAQATLWMSPAFVYMALPISVNGRVSDIWRSYIAQHFMHKDGSQLAFCAPYVYQKRNEHKDIQDFNAELDIYQKSEQLVAFLSSEDTRKIKTFEEMYKHLYQRGYLETEDIYFIKAWTQTLKNIQKMS